MANKKRKLTKNIERIHSVQEKHQKERKTMLRFLIVATVIAAFAIATSVADPSVKLDSAELCLAGVLLWFTYAGPILRIVWNNRKIREVNEQIAEAERDLQDWEKRLQEI